MSPVLRPSHTGLALFALFALAGCADCGGGSSHSADAANADAANADATNADATNADVTNADVTSADVTSADVTNADHPYSDTAASEASASDVLLLDAPAGDSTTADAATRNDAGQASSPTWRRLPPGTLGERDSAAAVYDSRRDRVVLFGGARDFWSTYYDDCWSWTSADGWQALHPAGEPPAGRVAAVHVYDPVADRVVIVGGWNDEGPQDDVWALDLTPGAERWSRLAPTGDAPGRRDGAGGIYDPQGHRLILFGGNDEETTLHNDLWALDLTLAAEEWTELTPSGDLPARVWWPGFAHDPQGNRAVLFGGYSLSAGDTDQLWSLDLTAGAEAWSEIVESGPAPRSAAGFAYDAANHRFVLFGGWGDEYLADVWALSATAGAETWSSLSPDLLRPSPLPRGGASTVVLPETQQLWVFGGDIQTTEANDLWLLDLSSPGEEQWTGELRPPVRLAASVAYDPASGRMLVWSGIGDQFGVERYRALDDLWSLDLRGRNGWTPIEVAGSAPSGRACNAVFDPTRGNLFIGAGGSDDAVVGDEWRLSTQPGAEAWSELEAGSTALWNAVILDAANDRAVFDGGFELAFDAPNRTRQLDLATGEWSVITAAGAPPTTRWGHAAVYDPAGQRMVVFGGDSGEEFTNELWSLSLEPGAEAWTPLTPAGIPPSARGGARAVAVPSGEGFAMIVYGGVNAPETGGDGAIWRLSLQAGAEAWTRVVPDGEAPAPRQDPAVIYDPEEDRLILFAGRSYSSAGMEFHNDIWELSPLGE